MQLMLKYMTIVGIYQCVNMKSILILLSGPVLFCVLDHVCAQQATCPSTEQRELAQHVVTASFNDISVNDVAPGFTAGNPALSCVEILSIRPSAPSGQYWLQSSNGSAVQVYCDMILNCEGVGGGWVQVVNFSAADDNQQCPPGTVLSRSTPIPVCGIDSDIATCSSTVFDVHRIDYNQVCGKIIGYQFALTDAFAELPDQSITIDDAYVDGVSLTYGSSPRSHIWTFASARDEVGQFPHTNCPCTNATQASSATPPPSFVANNYFCDTGSTSSAHLDQLAFYLDDPLWDGAGCGPDSTCCSLNNPPWFFRQLPSAVDDDVEMRICRDQHQTDENIYIETVQLYIR